jgi:hypothetical protein
MINMRSLWLALCILVTCGLAIGQKLPDQILRYLDSNFRGWKLAGECYEKASENKRLLVGDFDGNRKSDYAVKFARRKQGFLMVFLSHGNGFKPYFLHIYSAEDARLSDLMLIEKDEGYPEGTPRLKFDSPADFRCESDVGGVHTFRNGKFIAY